MFPIHIRKKLSHRTGVYIFRNSKNTVVYVGKAIDLFRRVRQYFTREHALGSKTKLLVTHIANVETIETLSEFEALLLEAKLIRAFKPKYNSIAKDDKSPLYIVLTLSENLPRIFFRRQRDLKGKKWSKRDAVFGPFQSSRVAYMIMKQIRSSIPFCLQKKRDGKPCFYAHIGLCDPCPSYIAKLPLGNNKSMLIKRYRRNVYRIRNILLGKITDVLHALEKEMEERAKNQEFEKAQGVKRHVEALYKLYTRTYGPSLYTETSQFISEVGSNQTQSLKDELQNFFPSIHSLRRIECIDISHTSGLQATGSLVVFTDGIIDTSQYRKFKIMSRLAPNDVDMIAEVIRRRFSHKEWDKPDLLIVDGGKPQVSKSDTVLTNMNIDIPVIGLAKRHEEIILIQNSEFKNIRLPWSSLALHLLLRIRDEAHRFARNYHRHLRLKNFIVKKI